MFSQRSYEPEIIDSDPPSYTHEEYADCLKKLDQIGIWLGGNRASLKALKGITPTPKSILDVGCGSGSFTILMAQQFPQTAIVGMDVNPLAISLAKQILSEMKNPPLNVTFVLNKEPELNERAKSYDVVISTLVCHHLDDYALKNYLKQACWIARQRVIINDLHRHPIAYFAFKFISPLFFPNRLIGHDGPLSVKRAFNYDDWEHYLAAAGINSKYTLIQWHWAFRWLVQINCSGDVC